MMFTGHEKFTKFLIQGDRKKMFQKKTFRL